jgi:hypothetical protein
MDEYIERKEAAQNESICRSCFHSYVCEQFNEHRDSDNKKCHFFNDHFVHAADVEEVRHGEWAGGMFDDVLTCKECSYEHALYVLGKLSATNYCPNCGAKMDGKGEGE